MTQTQKALDGRTLGALLVLNLLVHFVPFARPGFQPDDFVWLHLARQGEPWSFIGTALSQATRPLGSLLFMLLPYALGLHESTQLLVLIGTTSLLTALCHLYFSGMFPRPMAALATFIFVVWPVKHEIYASQLFGVNNLAAALIIAAAIGYRRWARTSAPGWLAAALLLYGLSIFTYEIGYLAPLVFYFAERSRRPRAAGAMLFLIPAALYALRRFTAHPEIVLTIGAPQPTLETAARGLASLASNLFGLQVLRNVGYGLGAWWTAPSWFIVACAVTTALGMVAVVKWLGAIEAERESAASRSGRATEGAGLGAALLLAAPAALVLVESRHSILASLGIALALARVAARLPRWASAALITGLMTATQGLSLRQAEVSQLQASVYDALAARRADLLKERIVVVDMASLAGRISYTWGDRRDNVLRGYWGLHAFAAGGMAYMVEAVLYPEASSRPPRVATCATGLEVLEKSIKCEREFRYGRPFSIPRQGTAIIDFKEMPLPPSVDVSRK